MGLLGRRTLNQRSLRVKARLRGGAIRPRPSRRGPQLSEIFELQVDLVIARASPSAACRWRSPTTPSSCLATWAMRFDASRKDAAGYTNVAGHARDRL